MDKEKVINYLDKGNGKKIFIIILVIIAVLVIVFLINRHSGQKMQELPPQAPPSPTSTPIVTPEPEKPKLKESPFGEFNPEQPKPTMPLTEPEVEKITKSNEVIQLTISPTGFSPKEFTVKAGQTVSLLITATGASHIFAFESPVLSAATTGITRDETRGFSFVAPTQPGDYIFFCAQSGHRERGEQGVMRVR